MPRQDINGNDLVRHADFPQNPDVRNIEFAAGKAYFGKLEFPNCFLTDLVIPQLDHFSTYANYEAYDCHYLDYSCDYLSIDPGNKTFDNIIFCNPYLVGFRGRFDTKYFLEKAHQLLSENGKVIVIGSTINIWSKFKNLKRHYEKLKVENDLAYDFEFELQSIDDKHPYRINHKFYRSDLLKEVVPNELIHIKKA